MNDKTACIIFVTWTCLVLALLNSAQAGELYVSSSGDDSAPGTKDRPLATIAAARDASRAVQTEPVTVLLDGGTYYLDEPIVFTAADSRSADAPVVYAAMPGESPIISGGRPLALDWQPYRDGILKADLPTGVTFDQMFVNGSRRPMARWPNFDSQAQYFQGFSADCTSAQRVARWADPTGGFLHAMHRSLWGDMHWRITGKTENGELEMVGGWQNNRQMGAHTDFRFIENIFEELDVPGEWYLDETQSILYFFPPERVDLSSAKLEVVRLKHLVEFRGSQDEPVKHITLAGLRENGVIRAVDEQIVGDLKSFAAILQKRSGSDVTLEIWRNQAAVLLVAHGPQPERRNYEANWESLNGYPVPEWFDDAKFGIFIHWGGYSEFGYRKGNRGYAEHTPKIIYEDPEHYYSVLKQRYRACPPDFGYKDIVRRFKAEKFDPDQWAKLFEDAGARYVVLTAEHHDGFALWDSDLTDWCATKVGPMRDLVGDLGAAVRKRGLKYAPSYHRERHTGFFALQTYAVHSEPRPDIAEEIRREPEAAGLYGPFSYADEFIADYVARWQEIQRKYRPDFMWLDDIPIFYHAPDDPQVAKFRQACAGMIADYLNAAQDWGVDVYLNNKGKHPNWPVDLGCLERDNMQVESIGVKWENPATLATSYGYMAAEEQQDLYQSSEKLIHLLCDVVSKNGNLLLNIGPRGDGVIPDGMQRRLLEMGQWLEVNGEAIYGTRPWKRFGEGIVPNERLRDELGRHTINSTGIRFTRSKDSRTVYAILLEPAEEPILVRSFAAENVADVALLGSDAALTWNLDDDGLHVALPKERPCKGACVLKVRMDDLSQHAATDAPFSVADET